jgi:hypothetical protein
MLFPKRAKVGLVALVVAGGAAAAAVLGPAGLAVGQSSPPTVGQSSAPIQVQIQVNSPATLVAKGAGVDVSVTASCSGPAVYPGGFVLVEVTEAVAKKIAYGFADTDISCTGTSQTAELLVVAGSEGPAGLPQGPSKAFAKGVALATASIQACPAVGNCTTEQIEPTIKIVK